MRTYHKLAREASVATALEAIMRAREGTEAPSRSKYDRPWVKAGVTRGHWYNLVRAGKTRDPRYRPRPASHNAGAV
jgi:hypothetical protein